MKGSLRVLSSWVVIRYSWLQSTGDEVILTEELNFKITTHVKMGMKSNATRGQWLLCWGCSSTSLSGPAKCGGFRAPRHMPERSVSSAGGPSSIMWTLGKDHTAMTVGVIVSVLARC